jgi:hypothetical protein
MVQPSPKERHETCPTSTAIAATTVVMLFGAATTAHAANGVVTAQNNTGFIQWLAVWLDPQGAEASRCRCTPTCCHRRTTGRGRLSTVGSRGLLRR